MDNTPIVILSILFLPLAAFVFLIFSERILSHWAAWIGVAVVGVCVCLSIILVLDHWNSPGYAYTIHWFSLARDITFDITINVDRYAMAMMLLVTIVALMVNIYSIEYKKGDRHYNRFFAYLGIFIFAMMGVILSDNLLITFIFWELVGFTSYLLIGFWYDKEKAVEANKKAFLVNRVADVFFLIAIMALWAGLGTTDISLIRIKLMTMHADSPMVVLAGACLFIGCMGKSAQFPFQVWLPDAMEGPTPVSALIHAATMVAAGVYLMVRFSFLIGSGVSELIVCVGTITAVSGAFAAMTQYDLKRVLAFSTISQLGYMMAGIGAGAIEASFFHLITHGFFKACLFLSAGSVIHGLHHVYQDMQKQDKFAYFDKQDMRNMGGVRKTMPITWIAFLISGAALAGIPFFSGYLSKDLILSSIIGKALISGNYFYQMIALALIITSCMTAFYITRLLLMVFWGKTGIGNRMAHYKLSIHENGLLMTIPLLILAVLSFGFVFSFNPFVTSDSWFFNMLSPIVHLHPDAHFYTIVVAVFMLILGIMMAYMIYSPYKSKKGFRERLQIRYAFIYKLSFHQLYLDKAMILIFVNPTMLVSRIAAQLELYIDWCVNTIGVSQVVLSHVINWLDRAVIDGIVTLTSVFSQSLGKLVSQMQNGKIQSYFLWMLLGIFVVVWLVVFY